MIFKFYLQPLIQTQWSCHTARVTSLNWSPDSQHIVSGSLDTNLICFEPPKPRGYSVLKSKFDQLKKNAYSLIYT